MRALTRTLLCPLLACAALASPAHAGAEAVWHSEQPTPPGSSWPVGLGHIGDIEFWTPPGGLANRGLLITAGSPPTVPAGVWAYNGVAWHPLASVCGATDGRVAWAGPEEFWTVSDGRAGQTGESGGIEKRVPLEDNTLCHFTGGAVAASYAHPAFEPDSYQAMHGAACLSPSDCWFAGDPLEEPQIGAFHLHWNGSSLEPEPYPGEGHGVADLTASGGRLYESVRVATGDRVASEQPRPPVVHRINPAGITPVFEAEEEGGEGLPLYGPAEPAKALDALRLSSANNVLWAAAANKYGEPVEPEQEAGQVTLVTRIGGSWTQLIGPGHPLGAIMPPEQEAEEHALLGGEAKNAVVTTIAADPGTESAWIGLKAPEGSNTRAVLVHVSAEGEVLGEQTLPSAQEQQEGIGPKGAAARLSCPSRDDCWLATTQGWLFHLAPEGERTLPLDTDPNFTGPIDYRPPDLGLPQQPADAPPPDTSGANEEAVIPGGSYEPKEETKSLITLPLLSHLHSRLIRGATLELRFHLAVKAKVKLVAKRRRKIVAATAMHTFAGGNRKLLLKLNPRRWPTKLDLRTHALAPLPVVPSNTGEGANVGTVTTGFVVLPRGLASDWWDRRP
jgi:hypothetical protein